MLFHKDSNTVEARFNTDFFYLRDEIQQAGLLLFNGTVNVDLILSEIETNWKKYILAVESELGFNFGSKAYLNNDGKMYFARAYMFFSSAYAKAEQGNFLYAMSLINEGRPLVGRALQYHQSVTVKNSIAGKARNKWDKNYPIVEKFYIDNTNGKGLNLSRDSRTSIIANHIEAEKIVDSARGEILKMIAQIKKCA
jgi:hypothetical protein